MDSVCQQKNVNAEPALSADSGSEGRWGGECWGGGPPPRTCLSLSASLRGNPETQCLTVCGGRAWRREGKRGGGSAATLFRSLFVTRTHTPGSRGRALLARGLQSREKAGRQPGAGARERAEACGRDCVCEPALLRHGSPRNPGSCAACSDLTSENGT